MANIPEFNYAPMFQLGEDKTQYRLLGTQGVSMGEFEGKPILKVAPEALTLLAQQAFHDVEFMLRREHNMQVAAILRDPEASENDKYVALQFLRNAETAAKGVLPFCQDTGTAIIHGEKGQQVWTGFNDEEALSHGVYNTFTQDNLRYSQNAALNMYDEVNTRCNLPAQIDIEATEGDEYRFVMVRHTAALPGGENEEPGNSCLPALSHRFRDWRHQRREESAHGEAGEHQVLRFSAHHGRCHRTRLPRRGPGAEVAGRSTQNRPRSTIWRCGAGPRHPRRASAAPWSQLPHRHGRELLGRPQHQGQNQSRRHLAGADGQQPHRAHPRGDAPAR